MKNLYSFVDADTEFFIGNLHELELAVCPRAGELVAFAADGQPGEVVYKVEMVRHIIHRNLDALTAQYIDVVVRPAVSIN